jgi:hypothetical protein
MVGEGLLDSAASCVIDNSRDVILLLPQCPHTNDTEFQESEIVETRRLCEANLNAVRVALIDTPLDSTLLQVRPGLQRQQWQEDHCTDGTKTL